MSNADVVAVIAQVVPVLLIAIVVDAGLQVRLAELRRLPGNQKNGPVAIWYLVVGSAGLTELVALIALTITAPSRWLVCSLAGGTCASTIALSFLVLRRVGIWSRPPNPRTGSAAVSQTEHVESAR